MLTNDDIDLLMDALESYETSKERSEYGGGILELMLMGDAEKAKAVMNERMDRARDKMRPIKEKIVLIKAELIRMKDKSVARDAGEFLKGKTQDGI